MGDVTLEVPLNAGARNIVDYHNANLGVRLLAYDSYGLSPLNGGRPNAYHIRRGMDQEELKENFISGVNELNKNNIPFYLVYTNLFCSREELEDERNMVPIKFLEESFKGNGVVVHSPLLEDFLRENFSGLSLISSCQRRYERDGLLSLKERVRGYREDLEKFNYVVLTPQDSDDFEVIEAIPYDKRDKLVSIINSPCQRGCNGYWDYLFTSLLNKFDSYSECDDDFSLIYAHEKAQIDKCVSACNPPEDLQIFCGKKLESLINRGIVNFKIGRGKDEDDLADMMDFFYNMTGKSYF